LKAAVGGSDYSVQWANDAQVAPYADGYYEYDAQHRVTKAVVSGAGCSACAGGQGTYTYAYTASTNPAGMNSWAVKTVETLPDGNQNVVYTNAYGEVMLDAYKDTAANREWPTDYRYDDHGRLVLTAEPSAVGSYTDAYADPVNYDAGVGGSTLNWFSGLITTV